MKSELDVFDGLDNRRELMILLDRLGSDQMRAAFLCSIVTKSRNGFSNTNVKVVRYCDSMTAYYMLVSICNELGVSINSAAKRLDKIVRMSHNKATVYNDPLGLKWSRAAMEWDNRA